MNTPLKHIQTVLIANRGEIACRIIRTAKSLGLKTIAVYTKADENALHTFEADQAVFLEDEPTQDGSISGYLCIAQIISAAKQCHAQAIHPGYGFLSENADFAEAVETAGLRFVGPKAEAIRQLGHKVQAKQIATSANVPILKSLMVSANKESKNTDSYPTEDWPWLIKAAAGGGGRGMRIVNNTAELEMVLKQAETEAKQHFGDATVFLEQFIPNARHVEVQIFGDPSGQTHHLWHRDCSVQRRYQKVIEEAPAPELDTAIGEAMIDAAIKLAQSQQYLGAGTVEFLVAPDGRWFFLEMNTRLQVEHPATEAISAEDLVAWQLLVADDQALPPRQFSAPNGHAIEIRICAENPEQNFAPAIGTIKAFSWPAQPHIRVDHALYQGMKVSPLYDSLLAKMIVWGPSRSIALSRLQQALSETYIEGVYTNLDFHRQFIGTSTFSDVTFHTTTLNEFATKPQPFEGDAFNLLLAAGTFIQTHCLSIPSSPSPWQSLKGWRHCQTRDHYHLWQVADKPYQVRLSQAKDSHSFKVEVRHINRTLSDGPLAETIPYEDISFNVLDSQTLQCCFTKEKVKHQYTLFWFRSNHSLILQTQLGRLTLNAFEANASTDDANDEQTMVSNMPGIVKSILVELNQTVSQGTPLLLIESMKIEQTISATKSGIIDAIFVETGEAIESQQKLVHLATEND